MDKNLPATKKDLTELETRLEARLETRLKESEERLAERIRDAQTEILRGFERFQTGNTIRMRKIEADVSNINTSATLRLENLEERVLEIEKKLMLGNKS